MKKILCLAVLLLGMSMISGCGDSMATNADLKEMKVENYVTLGDYHNLNVSAEPVQVDQEQWDQLLYAVYLSYVTAENGGVTDRAVKTGDTVIIDYTGKRDGVAFEGGTDTNAQLVIGSGQFINGFEEGLIGVMPGDTVDLELSFPEGYRNTELAGQAVVFTVTVNYILPDADQMEDSVIAAQELPEAGNVEELRQYVYDYLLEAAQQSYRYTLQNEIMEQLLNRCEIDELPESFVESYKDMLRDNISSLAAANGVDADIYTNYYYQMDSEDYIRVNAQIQARQEILMQAIANQEGLGIGDDELQTKLEEYIEERGITMDEALEAFSQEEYRNYFMSEKVMDFLIEKAEVTEPGE